jgi:hypothetical protein
MARKRLSSPSAVFPPEAPNSVARRVRSKKGWPQPQQGETVRKGKWEYLAIEDYKSRSEEQKTVFAGLPQEYCPPLMRVNHSGYSPRAKRPTGIVEADGFAPNTDLDSDDIKVLKNAVRAARDKGLDPAERRLRTRAAYLKNRRTRRKTPDLRKPGLNRNVLTVPPRYAVRS